MLPIESLLCPCCTPALLHTLAQTNLSRVPQQMLWLGTGALAATLQRQHKSRSRLTLPQTDELTVKLNAGGQPIAAAEADACG